MHIIIDGYNLIFQCGLNGRSAASDALEKSRSRLLNELSLYLDSKQRQRTTLVFDAKDRPLKADLDHFKHDGIQVSFAISHPDADSMIEDLIKQHSTPKQLLIVSSDHRLHKAAQRRRSHAMDSDVWYERLVEGHYYDEQQLPTTRKSPSKKPGQGGGKGDGKETFRLLSDEEIAALEFDVDKKLFEEPQADVASDKSRSQPKDSRSPFGTPRPENPFPENPFPPGYGEDLLDN